MPLSVIGSHASRIGCGDPELVQLPSNPLDAVAGSTPLQHHHPDAKLLQVIGQEPHVVPRAPNLLSIHEPLDETVVGIDQGSGKSVRCSPAGAVALRRHRGLDENHAIAEPRRELAVLLILDEAGDQVGHFIGLHVFGREHPVVGDEGHAAQNQIALQHQHLKHILRPPKAITLKDEHMRDRRIGLRIRQELQKSWTGEITARDSIVQVDVFGMNLLPVLHTRDIRKRAPECDSDLVGSFSGPAVLLAERCLLLVVAAAVVRQPPVLWSTFHTFTSFFCMALFSFMGTTSRISHRKSANALHRASTGASATRT